jgi:hypothetical protein
MAQKRHAEGTVAGKPEGKETLGDLSVGGNIKKEC